MPQAYIMLKTYWKCRYWMQDQQFQNQSVAVNNQSDTEL